jgi:hypothetical protein
VAPLALDEKGRRKGNILEKKTKQAIANML